MARIRSIHPEACTSATLAKLSASGERTFWRLLTHCDDYGKCQDRVRIIWAALYPEHEEMGPAEVERDLTELAAVGLIRRYEVDGGRFICVPSWAEFQHPQKPRQSKFPDPPEPSGTRPVAVSDVYATGTEIDGTGVEREWSTEGEGSMGVSTTSDADVRDVLFDSVCTVCGIDPENITKDERSRVNVACKQLREVGATSEEVTDRARRWRRKFPDAHLTPQSLTKSWSSLVGAAKANAAPTCSRCRQPIGAQHTPEFCERSSQMLGEIA